MKREGMLGWTMQRITAVIMLLMVSMHLLWEHFFIKSPQTMDKMGNRMATPFWFIFDAILLLVVVFHMLYGLYGIYVDFNPKPTSKKVVYFFTWILGLVLCVFGVWALVAFYKFGGAV